MADTSRKITEAVRERYSTIASGVLKGSENKATCCDSSSCGCGDEASANQISEGLYAEAELEGLPLKAAMASLGCGNPATLAALAPGEVALDLGSGGGIDVLLSAQRVGPTGYAYGLDMTDEMLAIARENAAEAGVENVDFLKGDIATIPLPDSSVDVIISNCVINLAVDKGPVFREAFRVLKPGGRFAVSDIVIHGGLPASLSDDTVFRQDLSAWSGCIAGALTDGEYRSGLAEAGFSEIDLEITRRYEPEDLPASIATWSEQLGEAVVRDLVGRFASTFVRARKPAT